MRYYRLEKLINLYEGYCQAFRIDQHHLMLLQIDGVSRVIESQCPHRGHPLTEADVRDGQLRCPLHGYLFDLINGDLLHATEETCRSLKTYELVYQEKDVGVML